MRVNLPQGRDGHYLSRAKEKITNLSLTVVTIFVITNLPYMVDEFIRQEIVADKWCTMSWCGVVEVLRCVQVVHYYSVLLSGNYWSVHGVQLCHQPLHLPPLQLHLPHSNQHCQDMLP